LRKNPFPESKSTDQAPQVVDSTFDAQGFWAVFGPAEPFFRNLLEPKVKTAGCANQPAGDHVEAHHDSYSANIEVDSGASCETAVYAGTKGDGKLRDFVRIA
jgi:hypothetical protein